MNFQKDTQAVANIIGAVIFTALIVSTLLVVQLEYIPLLEQDKEADRMRELTDDLVQLKGDIDQQVEGELGASLSTGLTVGRQGSGGFLRPVAIPGTVSFLPSETADALQVSSPDMLMQERNGKSIFGINETWNPVSTGQTYTNITQIDHMRLRIASPEGQTDGEFVAIRITDASGAYAGKLVMSYNDLSGDYAMTVDIYTSGSESDVADTHTETFLAVHQPAYYYRNLLDDNLLWNQVLAVTDGPFTLTMTANGLPAGLAMRYHALISDIDTVVGGSGEQFSPFLVQTQSGSLSVFAPNQNFPAQRYIMEHGAILLEQQEGTVVLVAPELTIQSSPTRIDMDMSFPVLRGSAVSFGGSPQYVVDANPAGGKVQFQGLVPSFGLQFETDYPVAWMNFWNDTMGQQGLTVGNGHFTIGRTADGFQLNIEGIDGNPNVRDINLSYQQARVEIAIRTIG